MSTSSQSSSESEFALVYTFSCHTSSITCIILHSTPGYVVSSSKDGTIKILNLETLSIVMDIPMSSAVTSCRRISYGKGVFACLLVLSNETLKLWQMTAVGSHFSSLSSTIQSFKIYTLPSISTDKAQVKGHSDEKGTSDDTANAIALGDLSEISGMDASQDSVRATSDESEDVEKVSKAEKDEGNGEETPSPEKMFRLTDLMNFSTDRPLKYHCDNILMDMNDDQSDGNDLIVSFASQDLVAWNHRGEVQFSLDFAVMMTGIASFCYHPITKQLFILLESGCIRIYSTEQGQCKENGRIEAFSLIQGHSHEKIGLLSSIYVQQNANRGHQVILCSSLGFIVILDHDDSQSLDHVQEIDINHAKRMDSSYKVHQIINTNGGYIHDLKFRANRNEMIVFSSSDSPCHGFDALIESHVNQSPSDAIAGHNIIDTSNVSVITDQESEISYNTSNIDQKPHEESKSSPKESEDISNQNEIFQRARRLSLTSRTKKAVIDINNSYQSSKRKKSIEQTKFYHISVFCYPSGTCTHAVKDLSHATCYDISQDNSHVGLGFADGSIRVYTLQSIDRVEKSSIYDRMQEVVPASYSMISTMDHTDRVTSIAFCDSLRVYATASADGFIHIHTFEKRPVRSICMRRYIQSISFVGNIGNLLVGMHGNIEIIRRIVWNFDVIVAEMDQEELIDPYHWGTKWTSNILRSIVDEYEYIQNKFGYVLENDITEKSSANATPKPSTGLMTPLASENAFAEGHGSAEKAMREEIAPVNADPLWQSFHDRQEKIQRMQMNRNLATSHRESSIGQNDSTRDEIRPLSMTMEASLRIKSDNMIINLVNSRWNINKPRDVAFPSILTPIEKGYFIPRQGNAALPTEYEYSNDEDQRDHMAKDEAEGSKVSVFRPPFRPRLLPGDAIETIQKKVLFEFSPEEKIQSTSKKSKKSKRIAQKDTKDPAIDFSRIVSENVALLTYPDNSQNKQKDEDGPRNNNTNDLSISSQTSVNMSRPIGIKSSSSKAKESLRIQQFKLPS